MARCQIPSLLAKISYRLSNRVNMDSTGSVQVVEIHAVIDTCCHKVMFFQRTKARNKGMKVNQKRKN